jgi:hypothetical protein
MCRLVRPIASAEACPAARATDPDDVEPMAAAHDAAGCELGGLVQVLVRIHPHGLGCTADPVLAGQHEPRLGTWTPPAGLALDKSAQAAPRPQDPSWPDSRDNRTPRSKRDGPSLTSDCRPGRQAAIQNAHLRLSLCEAPPSSGWPVCTPHNWSFRSAGESLPPTRVDRTCLMGVKVLRHVLPLGLTQML